MLLLDDDFKVEFVVVSFGLLVIVCSWCTSCRILNKAVRTDSNCVRPTAKQREMD